MEYDILDNGIKIYKIPIEGSNTIGLAIYVGIGSIYEDKEKRGISHLLEHMNFKTNYKYKAEEIDKGLELVGGISNAFTDTTSTTFVLEVIPDGFEKALDILYTIIDNKKFLEDEFKKEKAVVLSEINRYFANPETKLDNMIPKSIYGDSDYGDPIGGYPETVESITKEDIEEFKSKYYVANNMFIVLEGYINDNIVKMVKEKFKNIEEDYNMKLKNPKKGNGDNISDKMNTQGQIYYAINYNFDINDYIYLMSISNLLNGGVSSEIFQIFRNKYGIGYYHELGITFTYNDELIFSFTIPGFEKDREKYLNDAINDLLNLKINKDYIEGRKRRSKMIFNTKIKNNIFSRLYRDINYIKLFNKTIDQIHEETLKEMDNYENNKYLLEKLFDKGKKVIIYPNE